MHFAFFSLFWLNERMNIIHVYPLASLPRGLGHSFTYFTARELVRGALVEVEIGRRVVPAVVEGIENVEALKSALKRAEWRVKRVSRVITDEPIMAEEFFALAEWASDYFLIPPGLFLKQLFPAALLRDPHPTFNDPTNRSTFDVGATSNVERLNVGQTRIRTAIGTRDDRARLWANEAREALARHQSIFIITPTVAFATHIASFLSNLPRAPFVLTYDLSPAALRKRWQEIRQEKNGAVVVGTPMAIGAIRPDTETVIIDDASSPHFWQRESPHLPLVRVIEKLSVLRSFSLWKGKRIASLADLATPASPTSQGGPAGITYVSPRRKQHDKPTFSLVDLRRCERLSSTFHRKRPFPLFSREGIEAINRAEGKRVICFVNHRGYGTMLLCKDCGAPIVCPSCAIPLRLHTHPHALLCHHCGFRKAVSDRCPQCGSWNIEVYGIGIERVEEALREQFPHRPILRLDADTQKNKKSKEILRKNFLEKENTILLATEMLLEDPLLAAPLLFVPSLDFLFTFPELDLSSRVLRLLWELSDHAEESIIIQTFFPDHALFKAFDRGDPEGVLREELKRRKEASLPALVGWPPFSLLIKMSASFTTPEESHTAIERLASEIRKVPRDPAEPIAIQTYPAFIPKEKNLWRHHLLLRVDQSHWENGYKNLKAILSSLDSSFAIVVDPLSTL